MATFDLHAIDRGDRREMLLEVFDVVRDAGGLQIGDDRGEFGRIAVDFGCLRSWLVLLEGQMVFQKRRTMVGMDVDRRNT